MENKLAELEALLFIHGEPLGRAKIEHALGLEKGELDGLLEAYERRLAASERGLALVIAGERVQLATKPEFSKIIESFVKEELHEELTPASLEALALVAYLGPLSRSRLEYIRGVNSTFILRSLLLRGLIERFPDPSQSQAYLYDVSVSCVRYLGIREKRDLPDYEKFASFFKETRNEER